MISAFLPTAIRGRALGYVITSASIGLALGPVVGGFLTVYLGCTKGSFDLIGASLIFACLALVIYGLNQGTQIGWESNPIVGSFSLAVLCAIGLIDCSHPKPSSPTLALLL